MTASVAILVPVLNRPGNVSRLVASVTAATEPPWTVLFLATPGKRREHQAIQAAINGGSPEGCTIRAVLMGGPAEPGDYARKINHGVTITDEPYLFFGADDLDFHPGWFEAALDRMTSTVGVVGVNDLGEWRPNSPSRDAVAAGEHATHCLVARWYTHLGLIDNPNGGVLNEAYHHEFVDDEFTATARYREAWAYAEGSHVEHLHPRFGKAPTDQSYMAASRRIPPGRALYRQRAHLWGEDPPKR